MLACFRLGAVVLPCTEQLRAKDLRLRIELARPALILADERDLGELDGVDVPVLSVPDEALLRGRARRRPPSCRHEPCLITFTSGTAGEPKGVLHAQRYLHGQQLRPSTGSLPRRRARLVHGRQRLVEVGPQRVHRAVAARRGGAAARRALRPPRAAGAARARARRRAVHGADRVPRDRQARDARGRCRRCAAWSPRARR